MVRPLAALLLTVLVGSTPLQAQDAGPDAGLMELLPLRKGEPIWAGLFRLRAAAPRFLIDSLNASDYAQLAAQLESSFGNYRGAMMAWERQRAPDSSDVRALRARILGLPRERPLAVLERLADSTRVIMVSERHHAATDRVLTLRLLRVLRARGYRYFAAEALPYDSTVLRRGVVNDGIGYLSEPVFAEIIREAIRLGYTLVPYEVRREQRDGPDSLNAQQRRDYWQARNLVAATVARDPSAKVLVHAGFGHIRERATTSWSPMAAYFAQLSGINPVTVDQTTLTETLDPARGHALQRAVPELLDSEGWIFTVPANDSLIGGAALPVDLRVARGAPRTVDGRPAMLLSAGTRRAVRIAVPPCARRACIIEARRGGDAPDVAVLDRVEVAHRSTVTLFLPDCAVSIVVRAWDGATLYRTRRAAARGAHGCWLPY